MDLGALSVVEEAVKEAEERDASPLDERLLAVDACFLLEDFEGE